MSCCDFDTFCCSLRAVFDKNKIGWALIDWRKAKEHWEKYHCTGAESASMLIQTLKAEREPIVVANLASKIRQRQNQNDDD